MPTVVAALVVVCVICLSGTASMARQLRQLIPGLYGGDGIFLADPPPGSPFPTHAPHFTLDSASAINRLNEQIATEIAVFPFSSSVGGFSFAFESTLGTFVRTTETLGPLFAERAPTLGRGKFTLNVAFTFFRYNEFNGKDLDNLQVTTQHQPDTIPPDDVRTLFELDTIRIHVDLDIRVQMLTLAATYGVTNRLDIGFLVPIVRVEMDVKARAEVVTSPANPRPDIHTFVGGPESPNDRASDEALGIGDIILRAKYHLLKDRAVDLAAAMLVKLPTGDSDNFLGTGDTTIRPFVVVSRTFTDFVLPRVNVTPHLNLGFEWNTDKSSRNALEYVLGFDVGTRWITLAAEFLGHHELNGDGVGDDILALAVGAKWNPFGQLLLLANVQVPVNEQGLRSSLITTFGMEYSF